MFFPHSARAMISYSSLTFVSLYRIVHVKRAHLGFVQLCLNLTATIPRHQNYWVDSKAIGRWLASRLNNLTSEAWTWRAWRDVNRLLHLRFTSIRSTKDESCIHNGKGEKKFGQEIHLLKFTKTRECQRVSLTQKSFPPSPNLGRVSALEVGWKFSNQCLSETESRSRDEWGSEDLVESEPVGRLISPQQRSTQTSLQLEPSCHVAPHDYEMIKKSRYVQIISWSDEYTGCFRKNDKSKMFVKILIFTKIKFSQLF